MKEGRKEGEREGEKEGRKEGRKEGIIWDHKCKGGTPFT